MTDVRQLQERIEGLESKIGKSETELAELQGRVKATKEQIKKDFDCESLEEVEAKLKKIRKEKEDLEDEKAAVHEEIEKLLQGK